MRKFVSKLFYFTLIPLTILVGVYLMLNAVLANEVLNENLEKKISSMQIDTGRINVIIAGDSRAERQLSPEVIKEHTGLNTINIAINSGDLITTITAIKKYYPASRFIYVIGASSWQINDGAIEQGYLSVKCFQKMTFVEKVIVYKNNLSEINRLQFRLIRFYFSHIVHKYLHKKHAAGKNGSAGKDMGFLGVTGNLNVSKSDLKSIAASHPFYQNIKNDGVRWSVFKNALSEMGNMKSQFIIFQPPVSPLWRTHTAKSFIDVAETEYSKKLGSEIQKYNNISYLDFYMNDIKELNDSMYYDVQHLNIQGAKVFSILVSNRIMEVYHKSF